MIDLKPIVRSVQLPLGIWWLEDDDILGRGLSEPNICAYREYLYADGPSEGRIYVHPILIGVGHNQGPSGIRERVRNAIVLFQVAIEKGAAMHVGQGESLDWRKKL